MPGHGSFQDVLGQESLFSDADGACGLAALAGRFGWGSFGSDLVSGTFLTHVSQSVSSATRASLDDDFVIAVCGQACAALARHTLHVQST